MPLLLLILLAGQGGSDTLVVQLGQVLPHPFTLGLTVTAMEGKGGVEARGRSKQGSAGMMQYITPDGDGEDGVGGCSTGVLGRMHCHPC